MKKLFVLLFLTSVFTFLSCNNTSDEKSVKTTKQVDAKVVDYHNNVYYFACTQENFANALSQFINKHQELQLVAMTGDGTGTYGVDDGYFVVFKKNEH